MQSLGDILNRNYGIKEYTASKLVLGYTNVSFLILSKEHNYIFRISRKGREQRLNFESYILNYLSRVDMPFNVPRKINNIHEKDYSYFGGNKYSTLLEFIPGENEIEPPITSAKFSYEFGFCVAKLHSWLDSVDVALCKITHKDIVKEYITNFYEFKNRAKKTKTPWSNLLLDKLDFIIDEAKKELLVVQDSKYLSIVHGDLRCDNILSKGNKICAILDFDSVFAGDPAYDLSLIFVENYCKREVQENISDIANISKFLSFVKGYLKTKNVKKNFMQRVIDNLKLSALSVLSIIWRDLDFNEEERVKNLLWYSNIIKILNDNHNIDLLKTRFSQLGYNQ